MSAHRDGTFDLASALERMGGDEELLREVMVLFVAEFPTHLVSIGAAVAARDAVALIYAAHALKGAAASLSASAVAEASDTLETIGREGRIDAMDAAWAILQTEASRLLESLGPYAEPAAG